MEVEDAELASIGEARLKARRARAAFDRFAGVSADGADDIVRALASAAASAAEELARLAVDETGYGVYEDKVLKNLYNATVVADALLAQRTLGVLWVDADRRLTAVGAPMGVIAGVIPVAM